MRSVVFGPMPDRSKELIGQTRDLIESIKQLRDALLDYQVGCERLLTRETDRRARSTMKRIELVRFADKRERLTTAFAEFDAARRRARVGLISVAEEEGTNLSEVARTLGVSRQLLSRLANEEKEEDRS